MEKTNISMVGAYEKQEGYIIFPEFAREILNDISEVKKKRRRKPRDNFSVFGRHLKALRNS